MSLEQAAVEQHLGALRLDQMPRAGDGAGAADELNVDAHETPWVRTLLLQRSCQPWMTSRSRASVCRHGGGDSLRKKDRASVLAGELATRCSRPIFRNRRSSISTPSRR